MSIVACDHPNDLSKVFVEEAIKLLNHILDCSFCISKPPSQINNYIIRLIKLNLFVVNLLLQVFYRRHIVVDKNLVDDRE